MSILSKFLAAAPKPPSTPSPPAPAAPAPVPAPAPAPANVTTTYYVPPGNWTKYIVSSLGDYPFGSFTKEIMFGNGQPDPADGCSKNFTASYKCGDYPNTKSINIEKSADGKIAEFDCRPEFSQCADLRLTLTDDAILTLTNRDGSKSYWNSVNAFGDKGSIPLNSIVPADSTSEIPATAPITIPDYAGNGVPNSRVDVAAGGGGGRRYMTNYLESGQFLEYGQWIGSPSGTCRLIMGTYDDPTSLKVVKNILGCSSLDAPVKLTATPGEIKDLGCWGDTGNRALSGPPQTYGYTPQTCAEYANSTGSDIFALQNGGWCVTMKPGDNYKKYGAISGSCPTLGGPWNNHVYSTSKTTLSDTNVDTNASRLYTLPQHNQTVGKVAYVNHLGQLQLYPDITMATYTNEYEKTGNYAMSTGAELGRSFKAADVAACEAKCNNVKGDTQKCAGFVFDTTSARCQLLDKKMYKKNRIINSKYEHYVRQKKVTGQDVSCPSDVTIKAADFWIDMPIDHTDMTPATKCGLANFTQKERAAVANELPKVYNNLVYKNPNGSKSNIKYPELTENKPLLNKNKNGFKYWYESLQHKYEQLTDKLFNTNAKIDTTFDELQDSRKNLADWTGEQLQNLEAMNEDRDLNMMSQNYQHIMWSILAILIIIATMKFTKSVITKSPSV